MTRALPSQPSPQFLTNEMFGDVQIDPTCAPHSSAAQTPKQIPRTNKDIKKDIDKRRSKPTYSKMIEDAVFENSGKRKGTSLAIIKKHLQQKYGVDVKKSANCKRICRCIRESVSNGGHLKQMTGHGANGSFALQSDIRQKLRVEKEKSLIFKINIKTKSVPKKAAPKKERKILKADIPVTRMRVK